MAVPSGVAVIPEPIAIPCPICGAPRRVYLFEIHGFSVTSCTECGFTLSSPSDLLVENSRFSVGSGVSESISMLPEGRTQIEASRRYLQILGSRSSGVQDLLLVAEPGHSFANLAKDAGYRIVRHMRVDELERETNLPKALDAVVVIYQLERATAVEKVLDRLHEALKPGGELIIVLLSLDSIPARLFGQAWIGWRPENRYYFDNTTIQSLLWRSGFKEIRLEKDVRSYTLAHIYGRAATFPKTWITRAVTLVYRALPSSVHNVRFRLPTSGIVIGARKTTRQSVPVLSIIMPVYNEGSTFPRLMDELLAKEMHGVEKEIIVVESNSADNSRQLVMDYQGEAGVRIILQDHARGKGNAVREGLDHARGDIVLIQDADLEYDLNDYEALLEPVLRFKRPFVLGSRHGGRWKMRRFNEQEHISTFFNFGHALFTALINLLYGQHMKDPFTMFKVFRRDCLHDVKLECDRFDFDYELLIKLIRKGYAPLEIPVNYASRSYKEGKKIDMLRDPPTWIWASFKYRFAKITKG